MRKRGPATYKSEDMRAALKKLLSDNTVIDVHMLIRSYKEYLKEKTGVEPNIEVKKPAYSSGMKHYDGMDWSSG